MSINQVASIVQGVITKGGGIFVEGDASFTRTLTIGQILKARIMRHYEGGRYLAEIDGRQKVVDSAIPLRIGEVVHGRVTALGDKVYLKRISVDQLGKQSDFNSQLPLFGAKEQWLEDLFNNSGVRLNAATDRSVLLQQIARSSQPQVMALSGLLLNKIGTKISPEFLRAVYRVLNTHKLQEIVEKLESPYRLEIESIPTATAVGETVQQLAGLIESTQIDAWRHYSEARDKERYLDKPGKPDPDHPINSVGNDGSSETGAKKKREESYSEWLLGQRLLNTQSGGSLNHQLLHFPLWFGDRLIEVNAALFSQNEASHTQGESRHRRLVLSLETENLGHLKITANLADQHIRLRLVADNAAATELLAQHLAELKTVIDTTVWEIDEIEYVTDTLNEDKTAIQAVVEHHITQDSLSRLM
ncbi:MAG: flagellar hook-length control protein FliK [Candidatus Thiodiazotropha sp. 6PLUC2]